LDTIRFKNQKLSRWRDKFFKVFNFNCIDILPW